MPQHQPPHQPIQLGPPLARPTMLQQLSLDSRNCRDRLDMALESVPGHAAPLLTKVQPLAHLSTIMTGPHISPI